VLLVARALLTRAAVELVRPLPRLTAGAEAVLERHPWPGNVRELENVIRECVLFADGGLIDGVAVRAALGVPAPGDAAPSLEEALRRHDGNVTRAARALGVSRPTLYARMRAHGLVPRGRPRAMLTGGR
jgi:DNA-binding NtrC family response regulator